MRLTLADYAMGVAVALVWGMGFVFAKAAVAHFPPILLMALRFGVTALALVWFVRPPLAHMGALLVISLIGSALQYSMTFTGLKGLDASATVLVLQLEVPFLTLLGAIFLGERVAIRKWIGIALAFAGVYLIAGEPRVAGALHALLLVMAGAFTWAIGQALIRRLEGVDGLTVTTWVAVLATVELTVISLIFEEGHVEAIRTAGPVVWITVAYMGLVMTALGYWLWNSLIRRHPISSIAPFLLLLPVFSTAGAIVFLGEALTPGLLVGGAIVLAGLALILIEWPRAREVAPGKSA
ncbi:MAG: EamA family transporter [Rhizobiales bacterium]|nr:EamA family transporter [Hyphomicrobiales bacterium]